MLHFEILSTTFSDDVAHPVGETENRQNESPAEG